MYSRVLRSDEIERLGYIESIHPLLEGESKKLNPAERNLLVNYYLNRHDPSYKKVQAVLAGKRKALNDLKNNNIKCHVVIKSTVLPGNIENIEKILVSEGHLSKNDKYIITSSMPTHWRGHTNMMKINVVDL